MLKLISRFIMTMLMMIFKPVYADGMATATATGVEGQVQFTNAIRTVYAKEIEFKALPNMRFLQFATVKTQLGVEPGLTISMLIYDNLALGGKLSEGVRMTTQALSSNMKSITVGERGNAVSVSELLLQSSFDDIMASATTLLARDMAMVLDTELRDVALAGTNVIYGRGVAGAKVAGRPTLVAESILSVAVVKDAVEILATNNAPKFAGNYYICFIHPHQSRSLRDDSAWINASNYGAPEQLFTGEIGKIDDVRFVETTLMSNGAVAVADPAYSAELIKGAVDGNATFPVYQAVLFGENFYAIAYSLPVELRDNGVTDFGREHGIAWYAIWGTDRLHDEYGVVIETV